MSPGLDYRAECEEAARRIGPYVRHTPVECSPVLSEGSGSRVHLKLENLQETGSFKLRGATNALLSLPPGTATVVAASSGNHGLAVARAARLTSRRALIFVPESASASKLQAIESLGGQLRRIEGDPVEAEIAARAHAEAAGLPYVSPYNDPAVVAGQGTVGVELAADLPAIDVVVASMGGGGLIAGVGGYLKRTRGTKVLACSPENSAVMHESLAAGRVLELPSLPTLSDGTAGGLEADTITFEMCRDVVDHSVTVSEDEIRRAMRLVIERHGAPIEGAAGVAVAGFLKTAERWRGLDVAVVLCGGNVSAETLRSVVQDQSTRTGV
jgi:threonine dehydratase